MKLSKVWLLVFALAAVPLSATDTTFWQVGTYDEFLQGTLHDVSLNKDGVLRLAPEAKAVFSPEETLALSLATDKDRNIYIGTGHQGKVFKVAPDGKGSLFFIAREPEIFALASGTDGSLFVGSSPEGKIYRVTPDGKWTVFSDPKAKYIWALAFDEKGILFAATGDQGKILKIDASGKAETFFDSKQTHIMCLNFDREGNLLAGSVPNGLIYRISSKGKAFVLYQAGYPEIHDIALDSDGRIYAAALGGAGGKGTPDLYPSPAPGPVQGGVTTITVTASTETASKTSQEVQGPAPGPGQGAVGVARPGGQTAPFQMPQIPQGRGSLILVRPDQTVETIWSSNNESVFGLAARRDRIFFSTDSNGRIFELTFTHDGPAVTLLTETKESLANRLLLQGSDLYIATSNIAKLFRIANSLGKEGNYESPVKDTKFISKWGKLSWKADAPPGSLLEFYSRAGNSERPDQTWSDWAGPYTNPEGSAIQSPSARYIQWKALLKPTGDKGPMLNEVTVSYLNQNLPPQVRSLSVSSAGERTSPTGTSPSSVSTATITVSAGSSGSSVPMGANKVPTIISWQADDPNGDQLIYSVYVRAADEREWHLLKDKLRQTNFTVEPNTLPDGKYVARVVASDEESNSLETRRTGELISAPFWIDNTPPVVTIQKTSNLDGNAQVQFLVQDTTSPLRAAEFTVDGKDWRDVVSDDGVVDSKLETFTVHAGRLEPGEHVIVLRAFDFGGNAGLGKAVVRIPAGTATQP